MVKLLPLLLAFAATAAAQTTCKVGELPQSGNVQGTFVATDCAALRYLSDVPDNGRAQGWLLTATAKTTVFRFRLTASQSPVRLYLNDLSATLGGSETQSTDGAAELTVQLPAGRYLLVAVLGTNTLGSYQLSSESRAPRRCEATGLTAGTDVAGTLSTDGCAAAEYLLSNPDSSSVNPYKLVVSSPGVAKVSLTSAEFSPGLTFLDSKGQPVQADTSLTVSVDPGTYTILAGTQDGKTGNYTLRVDLEERRPCPVSSISPGGKVSGELKLTGCRVLDVFGSETDDRAIEQYQFEVASPTIATALLTSNVFDTEMYLLDSKMNVISSNDDADQTTTDSFVGASLAPCTYTLLTTTHDGAVGAYGITLSTQGARTCAVGSLNLPGTSSASLSTNGCRYLDAVQPGTVTYPSAVFRLTVPKTSFVTLTSTSPAFATGIELRSATGELLSSTSRGNQVAQLVPAGEYRVIAYSGGSTGTIGVTAATREPAACGSTVLTTDGIPLTASLTTSGCALRELVALPVGGTASNLFTFEVDRPGKLRIGVETSAFVSNLFVLAEDGKVIAADAVQTDADLVPGKYQVVVTTTSASGGDYTISASWVDAPAAVQP